MKTQLEIAVEVISERVDVLAGARTRDKTGAAVRIRDLTGILQVPPNISAKPATAAPTKAEYDLLLHDVTVLATQLRIVADALHKRLTP